MWYHWLIFCAVGLAVIGMFLLFRLLFLRPLIKDEKQKKSANLITIKYICLYLLFDLLYMSIFNNWRLLIYIFGILAVLIIFVNLAKAFLSDTSFLRNLLPVDLLAGVGLSIYLIYIIENTDLRAIVTAVVAALYGGLLTLIGVAWTIKHAEKQRQDEERKKYKPFVNLYHPTEEETIKARLICCCKFEEGFFNKKEKDAYLTEIESFLISNTDFSSFHVMGFKFNDQLVRSKSLMYIDKNSFIRVSFSQFYSSMEIKEFSMWILDGLGNIYEVDFSLKREKVALENGCIYNKIMVTGNRFPKLRQENWNEF